MKISGILGTAFAIVLFSTVSTRATVLSKYPFTGSSLASTDTDPASVTGDITLDSGLTDTTRFTASGNPGAALRINTDETAGSNAGSLVANEDFVFTLTPGTGEALHLNTLTFDLATSTAAFTTNVLVQLSGTGAAGSYTSVGQVASFSTSGTYTAESIDLTPANSALAAGGPLFVRVVVNDNVNDPTLYTGFDNIVVNGTVVSAVPEPATSACLAFGVSGVIGGLMLRRRWAAV